MRWRTVVFGILTPLMMWTLPLFAASQPGASFLDIPVGAQAAALGSAYSALADNAYAPVWNPAGLGFNSGMGVAAEHLDYLDSLHYEYLSAVTSLPDSHPESSHRGLKVSAQYLGSGDITRTDIDANGRPLTPGGSFSNNYGSYNVGHGQTVTEKVAVGASGKWIHATLDDVSANAYGVNLGTMYNATSKLRLAGGRDQLGCIWTMLR